MDLKLNLLVLRCRDIETSKVFYEHLGVEFQKEKHGAGPEHYAVEFDDTVLELYPLKEGDFIENSRLGFSVNLESDLGEMLHDSNIEIISSYEFNHRLVFVVQDPDGRKIELYQSEDLGSAFKDPNWFRIRVVLMILAAFVGSLSFLQSDPNHLKEVGKEEILFFGVGYLVAFVMWPFMIMFVVGFQVVNPFSDKIWTRPTHHSNPFRLKNPLLVTHFLMFFVIAQGAGMVLTSILGGWMQFLIGIGMIVGGLEGLWALELVMRKYPKKIAPEESNLLEDDAQESKRLR